VYDAATVNGVAMVNVKARMAEAYTATSQTGTKITDAGLSYSARGQVTDAYESTPHSGGYYHVTAAYWANGALNQLSGLTGLPAITYNLDGEGRVYSVSASSGQNPLSNVTYNVASQPTQITLGSSDSDAYSYDPNTNRVTQYQFNVNGQSVVGALTWSPIGTLESLNITDPFNSANAQNCSYTHDDLVRIASANCGSIWSQTFSYDPFGNINKSGTSSFQAAYSNTTNHMTLIGTSTPSYDANGNVTNDFLHTFAWDAVGKATTIDGIGLTYDALGRMAEKNQGGGSYSEIVYSPTGAKLAIMNGQSLQKAFVPLAGGSVAVYNASGLAYYRHADHLGSSRLASTPTRTMYSDVAYAPFGEQYAQAGTADPSFTGMNQDTVAGLYDFPAREYNPVQGRWPSPDPAGLGSVTLTDPQTLNRYAYVRNSPLGYVDPQGMCGLDEEGDDDGCAGGGDPAYGSETDASQDGTPEGPGNNPAANEANANGTPGGYFNGIIAQNAAQAYAAYVAQVYDPCVYLNDAGNGVESVDPHSNRGECTANGGLWVNPGDVFTIDANGNFRTFRTVNSTCIGSDDACASLGSNAGLAAVAQGVLAAEPAVNWSAVGMAAPIVAVGGIMGGPVLYEAGVNVVYGYAPELTDLSTGMANPVMGAWTSGWNAVGRVAGQILRNIFQ
jgi:RHS repeat-associated protein